MQLHQHSTRPPPPTFFTIYVSLPPANSQDLTLCTFSTPRVLQNCFKIVMQLSDVASHHHRQLLYNLRKALCLPLSRDVMEAAIPQTGSFFQIERCNQMVLPLRGTTPSRQLLCDLCKPSVLLTCENISVSRQLRQSQPQGSHFSGIYAIAPRSPKTTPLTLFHNPRPCTCYSVQKL
jgi:hypothetical protein